MAFDQVEKLEEQCSKLIEVILVELCGSCIHTYICDSVGLIKYKSQFEKWNSRKFIAEAEETYKDMNDAFARWVYTNSVYLKDVI
jgi:hypothetical protein